VKYVSVHMVYKCLQLSVFHNSFECGVRCGCSFCWWWWNCWPIRINKDVDITSAHDAFLK